MEDQQPCPGGLTDEAPDEAGERPRERDDAATGSADASIDGAEVDRTADDGTSTSAADEAAAEESAASDDAVAPAKRRTGRWLALVAGVSAALLVGSAAFAGAALQPYLADRALVATKLEIVQTAVNAITALWNYTPENMDTLADRASTYLSGDLEADYRKFIDAIAATNKQAKVTDSTVITGAAVESLNSPEATVVVYTNTTATSAAAKSIPWLKYLSYRIFMRRGHDRWLVTRMTTITSFDLTPKL
ncbi:mammalian cell entry protein [Candidatus Mycobacterium methanotrophicum]|uniref:Mammalian cell entry protein n=1 Tax=Candidatus Mycobacterium methanotrophicum TaxID=2943498 RepID=A0ABY4QKW8_9MYCO|nr:mammalian cell entry protein [Candidatus Mycobacterium methanotrophicum]UQX10882.1 mammalian cell entry protein [Candidatus Mycobacterium methanotrophicum]